MLPLVLKTFKHFSTDESFLKYKLEPLFLNHYRRLLKFNFFLQIITYSQLIDAFFYNVEMNRENCIKNKYTYNNVKFCLIIDFNKQSGE